MGISMGGVGGGAQRPRRPGNTGGGDDIAAVAGNAWSLRSSVVATGAAAVVSGARVVGDRVGEGYDAARRSELG